MRENLLDPSIARRVIDLAVAIQQIPAPTFSEGERAAFLKERFLAERLSEVSIDSLGNVTARIQGAGLKPPMIVSAHTDTVFPAATSLSSRREDEKIYGPGLGDNSLGVAGLFGLLWSLKARNILLPGDVWLVANVGEEGLGDLCGMRAVVDRFGSTPLAYLILEGMALGQIYHRGLGVQRYRVTITTGGGHSWVDYGRPSAIHELGDLISRLARLPLPHRPRTSLNVGMISGGTSINTIAPEAWLDLDLRSESADELQKLTDQVERLVTDTNRNAVRAACEIIGQRPAGKLEPDHPLVQLAQRSLEEVGLNPNLSIGSTDANIPLSRGMPAICVGVSLGGGAHTVNEYIYAHPVAQGVEQIARIVEGAFQVL